METVKIARGFSDFSEALKDDNGLVMRKREKWADPALLEEVRRYGIFDANACLNCGGCTVVCSLTSNGTTFSPRKNIQYVRVGLRDKLRGSLDPWLCYYCGDCSTSCPRQTETGESIMTLRRYLTGLYDWTGFSARFFKSKVTEIAALIAVGLAMLTSILLFFYPQRILEFGHFFTLVAVGVVLLLIFFPNMMRMYMYTLGTSKPRPPLLLYLTELKTLVFHAVAQLQLRKCNDKGYWLKHWFVAAGYILTLGSAVVLGWTPKTYVLPPYHPFNLLGIIGSICLLTSLAMLIADRVKKRTVMHKFSELSDWLFAIFLFAFVFMLLLAYIFLSLGLESVGYAVYTAHLVLLAPWAFVIVPFSKTPHLLYRPLAIYFHSVKEGASLPK